MRRAGWYFSIVMHYSSWVYAAQVDDASRDINFMQKQGNQTGGGGEAT